jgi:phosphotransferase system enzyme I (PtsI)
MLIKKGIPVSPGVAISCAVVLDAEDQPVPRRKVPPKQVAAEHKRLETALGESTHDIKQLADQATARLGTDLAKIFGFHLAMLQDQQLVEQFKQLIQAECVTAEYAVYTIMRRLARMFLQQDNRYFRERVSDIWDLERRIMGHLIGHTRAELANLTHEAVVIAHDLTPSQTASLDTAKIRALATDAGGSTSHTAILAHALGIPAIVGLEDLTAEVNTGDTVIIDGNNGIVVVDPDAEQLMSYRQEVERMAELEGRLVGEATLPAKTTDGTLIDVMANIEFPSEINAALQKGASGIGLYRTEFLFLAADTEPTEQCQYEAYLEAIRASGGRPLTIRTLDLGADKIGHGVDDGEQIERNPFLGCRSIRLCLQNLTLFKTQLRAILRASTEGPVRIMFPLISNIMELRQAKMILNDVREDLEEQSLDYSEKIPVGMMIEVPSAALQAARFSQEVDFFSIGTNDLIQYTVAVDRGNERIASLYSAAHPAVIQLVRDVVRAANHTGIDVSLCGEMAGRPEFVMLLIGLGLRSLSMTPPAIPELKKIIRSVSVDQCKRVARKAGGFDSDREITNYLRAEVRKAAPDIIEGYALRN